MFCSFFNELTDKMLERIGFLMSIAICKYFYSVKKPKQTQNINIVIDMYT